MVTSFSRTREWAWALYDVGNSAFATTVIAAFFPIFLKQYWASTISSTESTFWLGIVNSGAALVALILAPFLGTLSDVSGLKKKLLLVCVLCGVSMSAGLFWAPSGNYALALGLYGLGFISFSTGMVFYDALLPSVTEPRRFERVSSFAVGIGYLGGGTLFAGNIWMAQHPEWFGFLGVESSVKTAFLMVAVWWFLFTLPLLYFVKEKAPAQKIPYVAAMKVSLSQLRDTFHEIKKLHIVMRFLVAYWLYIDGVDTIIQMAVDYALSVGFDSSGLMKALLITQFVGVPATLIYGRLGERYGAKTAILSGLLIYAVVVVWGAVMTEPWEFYGIAVIVGLVQGGVQALSRALFAHLIPLEKAGEFFGFMNLLSKFAAVLGPMLVGTVSHFTGEPRLSMLSLLILFALGAVLLQGVTVSSSKEKGH